jgi:hypothetical protein
LSGGRNDRCDGLHRLASSFMGQINNDISYVRVPHNQIKLIEEYVAFLDRAQHPAA